MQEHGIIPVNQRQGIRPGNREGALSLTGTCLLLHFQLSSFILGGIDPQSNFAAGILLGNLIEKVLVIHCIKIERAYHVTAVHRVLVRHQKLGKTMGKLNRLLQVQRIFFLLPQNIQHNVISFVSEEPY